MMPERADPITLLHDAREFLAELAENNNRDWFKANKHRYDTQLKRPAERLIADISGWLDQIQPQPVRGKLFRAQRDVRFSDDKTPYHTHLHMLWSLPDGRGWFLGIAEDYASAGAGMMGFEKNALEDWRDAVAGEPGEELQTMIDAHQWRLVLPDLKRVPPPHDSNHPRETLLRRKGFVAWQDGLDDALANDPLAAMKVAITRFDPLISWLGSHVVQGPTSHD